MTQSKLIFITGTDTDVGKTVISLYLLRGLHALGHQVTYWKPLQSGLPADETFIREHAPEGIGYKATSHVFQKPASPDQSAAAEGREGPDLANLLAQSNDLPPGITLAEGAGGLYVPINDKGETWVDLLRELQVPVVVVARSGLGTLNHTTLTVNALRDIGIQNIGVVLSGPRHQENESSLELLIDETPVFPFEHVEDFSQMANAEALASFILDLPERSSYL